MFIITNDKLERQLETEQPFHFLYDKLLKWISICTMIIKNI